MATEAKVLEEENTAEVKEKIAKGTKKAYRLVDETGYRFVKRSFDIICGSLGCVILVPVTILVKFATMTSRRLQPNLLYTKKDR